MFAMLPVLLLAASVPHVRSVAEPEVRVGDMLTLHVDNLAPAQCKTMVPFIDGLAVDGLTPDCSHPGEARFTLAVNEKNAETWHALFARAPGCCRTVSVSAGSGLQQLPTDVLTIQLRIINRIRWLITIVLALIATAGIFVLRWRTSLLTNLPRLQIAFFIVVIGLSYGYIWSTTGEVATLNGSALALLGIGAGTAAGNAIFASGRRVSVVTAAQAIANAGVEAPVETAVRFNLYSLQSAVWTTVIGVIFFGSAYRSLEMPDLDTNVLLVLGISAGTYLALAFSKQ